MDRRIFLAGSASLAALIASPVHAAPTAVGPESRLGRRSSHGLAASRREVVLEGYLAPARAESAHYAVFSESPFVGDPGAAAGGVWPQGLVRVHPEPGAQLPASGRVRLVGRLARGRFPDAPTGHVAQAVFIGRAA